MSNTINLNIPLIAQNQAQKEVTVNEALCALDAILNRGAEKCGENVPPISPKMGEVYIIGSAPTGAWAGQGGKLTYYNTKWKFISPNEGMVIWVKDEDVQYIFNGTEWVPNQPVLNNLPGLGVNASYDATNKLAVKSEAVLFNHNGSSSQVKVNKAAGGNTASHLFQTNYSGRAEFGLVGDDDFQLKVSNDGGNWRQAFVVDRNNGNIEFKQHVKLNGCVGNVVSANSGAAYNINLENGNVFDITLNGNCSFNFINVTVSGVFSRVILLLKQDAIGGRSVTWPQAVKWPGGAVPVLGAAANAVGIFSFITIDGGMKWFGKVEWV